MDGARGGEGFSYRPTAPNRPCGKDQVMELPLDRERLKSWNQRERSDDVSLARSEGPGAGLILAIQLSALGIRLNRAATPGSRGHDLDEKSRLYAAPLRAITSP